MVDEHLRRLEFGIDVKENIEWLERFTGYWEDKGYDMSHYRDVLNSYREK